MNITVHIKHGPLLKLTQSFKSDHKDMSGTLFDFYYTFAVSGICFCLLPSGKHIQIKEAKDFAALLLFQRLP